MATSDGIETNIQENTNQDCLQDPDPHQAKVEAFFKPLEAQWDVIRDVLLWKKPVYSLCVFVVVNGIFSYFASGHFRLFLIVTALLGLCLCVEELRSQVASVLERAGITPEERESYEASLIYQRFCYKIALMWTFSEIQLSKLKNLKENSKRKYYILLTVLFIVAAFAYQYVPWLKVFYGTLLLLYLWPPAKYHGTHRVLFGVVDPFIRPFITHWKHSRTKRQRNQIFKAKKGEDYEDSEEEFAKEFIPQTVATNRTPSSKRNATAQNDNHMQSVSIPQQESGDVTDEQQSFPLPAEPMDNISSSSSQDLLNLDLPEIELFATGIETQSGTTASLNSSASFLPDSQEFPSFSTNADHWDFEDDDFSQGLEFPDIDGNDYHSSTESLDTSHGNTEKRLRKKDIKTTASQQVKRRAKKQNQMTSSQQSNITTDGTDFELLDRSEIEDMDQTIGTEQSTSAGSGSLGIIGKWLGL